MSGIYLIDLLAQKAKNENTTIIKRNLFEIDAIIRPLIPSDIQWKHAKQTEVGFIYKFRNDQDINPLFDLASLNILKQNNLKPDLTKEFQKDRVIFLHDICADNFELDPKIIAEDIMAQNNLNIIKLDKFTPKYNPRKRYLRMYLDSKQSCIRIANKGEVKVFNEVLVAVKMRSNPFLPARLINNVAQKPGFFPSHQQQAFPPHYETSALPHTAHWGGPHVNNTSLRQPIMQTPNNLAPSNATLKENHIKASILICEVLSNGMENPKEFVNMCQETLKIQGYKNIIIPKEAIESSRYIFMSKNPPPMISPSSPTYLIQSSPPNIIQSSSSNIIQSSSPKTTTSPATTHSTPSTPKTSQTLSPQSGPALTSTPPTSSQSEHLTPTSQSINKSLSSITPPPSSPTLTSDSIITSCSSNDIRLVPKYSNNPSISTENRFTPLGSQIS